ncbi:MCE family protein [Nocardioides sp. KR10-350]|uniref:MCE family protein n=1 Tax=Nocardioides cheoyonin TaxID=3156615 RepID=UPI0032B330C4
MILKKLVVPLVIAALVLASGVYLLFHGSDQKELVAHFPRTVSIYEGSDVRVLGVPVGKVDKVTPDGTDVVVTMHYDSDVQVPADAKAVIVAPSIVGDRYVQLTPAYTKGAVMADGAELSTDRTAVPLELDQIYSSLDNLVVALGPTGANKNGALTDLLQQTARNFGGQGTKVNSTIHDLGTLTKTLDDNKDQLFGSARQLESFVGTLAKNDTTVRKFTTSLDSVSKMLAGERDDLATALHNLSIALGNVTTFVKDNKAKLRSNISGLNRVAKVLVKRRDSLAETLKDAPLALNNLYQAYNPDTGTLDTNANLTEIAHQITSDPSTFLCGILYQADKSGKSCNVVKGLLPRGVPFGAGTGSSYGVPTDPTLGGLVEVPK